MHCERFDRRFHELLDLRQSPASDPQLLAHAAACEVCEETLQEWLRVEELFADPPRARPAGAVRTSKPHAVKPASAAAGWRPGVLAATLAASLLGGVWFAGGTPEREPAAVVEPTTPAAPLEPPQLASIAQLGSRVAQPEWWGSVVRAAWEPVDPLAEGIRPLTNSLQTALELLTPRPGGAGMPGSGVPSSLPEDANVGLPVAPSRLV